ncbi:LOW QUALITY PROTEIN: protein ITPRID2 [Bufo gargarizans]|uniref:LOW QUALITY PROTEIN: protein ITPRID2 n=1 Tax=Bufo gargarizans TaxID=30331 RepID=UPI001CF16924|nr:LOW QUALITY PROTEIN: protein ITPRID2 [Bufo gargarizans]
MEEAQSRAIVTERRKAWAKSRDSWQASEAEDVSAERGHIPRAVQAKLRLADGSGNIPNEKIAIWLNDCRTPLGASLDEQSSALPGFPKGMIIKNGNSFEDDLSLGAEANHLHQRFLPMEPTFNGMLAQDRRLQFHQKGRSMNSTGSGKSSATVSSVSELLDLYEEDPEEILYNLGFGRDEPDIASKIPPRFFNNSSFANGIDIKVFLNAQMQRLELENPNYALTSRFRQIKVLTEVANAFSSLYSQVSGTPLQQIGSSKSLTTTSESKPAPLTRSSSQTAARLMETLSKLNLCGPRPLGETNNTSQSLEDKGPNETGNDDESRKSDQKVLKPFKPLATVKEEVPNSSANDTGCLDVSVLPKENGVSEMLAHSSTNGEERPSTDLNECDISIVGSPTNKDLSVSTDQDCEHYLPEKNPSTSTPERELCLTNPSISGLLKQDKESFELEELQSAEEEPNQVPPRCRLTLEKIGKDNLLRTASQHSDSSGFAEDTSGDCVLTNSLPGQDSLQAMGSSADSYDSETTVTSIGEDLRTPLALDERESIDLDEFLTPVDLERNKFFPEQEPDTHSVKVEVPNHQNEELKSSEDLNSAVGDPHELSEEDSDLQHECTADSELEMNSEYESISYTTHHISEALDSFPEYDRFHGLDSSDTRSLDRVSVALQRAQKKILSSGTSDSRAGRGMITSRDLLKRRHKFTSCGYPLRRTQSLPSPLLSPVRVVSKVNIVIHSGKATVCSPPSFSYRYTPEEEDDLPEQTEELGTKSKSTVFRSPVSDTTDAQKSGMERMTEDLICRSQSCNAHAPSHRSHSSCSLHSSQFDWHERPLCEHARAWSTHSVPNFSGASCGPLIPPFSCSVNQRFGYGSLHRSCSGCSLPLTSPPSTTEMQLRRVLHDIRSSLQNLSQHPVIRGHDLTSGGYSQKSSILSLYENTFQELQIMRRSLNLFRTQMMDLELNMLRQQTMVYPHLTEEERYEADQLQGLRNSVRIELQELELQLDERLLTLEEQLRSFQVSSPFQRQAAVGMYGGRGSTDSLVFSSGLNVMEPVNELIREQSHLKSELGLDSRLDHGADRCESVFSQAPSDSSSVCSTPHKHRKGPLKSSDSVDKFKAQTPPGKSVYRATVALTPSPPTRAGGSQSFADESPEGPGSLKLEPAEKRETEFYSPVAEGGSRWSPEENQELQQVIREIKEAIVGDIRREIVSGLLAAVSSPVRSMDGKNDGRI